MSNGNTTTDPKAHWIVKALDRHGIAVVMLLLLSLATWKSAVWFGENVAMPIVNRQIQFIDKVDVAVDEIARAAEDSNLTRLEMVHQLKELSDTSTEQTAVLEEIKAELKKQ